MHICISGRIQNSLPGSPAAMPAGIMCAYSQSKDSVPIPFHFAYEIGDRIE